MTRDQRAWRTVWRWHFYAGLLTAPFLLILAVTGAVYLFDDELNDLLMPELRFVQPVARPVGPAAMIRAALAAHPGRATQINMPEAPDRPAQVRVRTAGGTPLHVMVDPNDARVLGSYVYGRTLVGFADTMHGSLTLGPRGDAIVELAACWALVLIVTGAILWWPRGRWRLAGTVWPRLALRGRAAWREAHVVTGVWTVGLIAFLLLTGLPWAVVQGPVVRGAVAALGIGNPADAAGYAAPRSAPLPDVPWSQADHAMPASDPAHAGHGGAAPGGADAAGIAGADRIVALAAARGIAGAYRLHLPDGPTGVYAVVTFPGRPQGQRTLVFDRWTAALIGANGWPRYGVGARAIELGVQIHMGRYFGRANQLLMLVPCIGIVVLVASGAMMWWRRRPRGRLGAPPRVSGARLRAALAALVVAGLAMPLLGASLIVVAVVDRLVVALSRRRRAT